MIKKIVIDGNDGTGKSVRVSVLKKHFPGIEIEDRGVFSEATLRDELFGDDKQSRRNLRNFIWSEVEEHPETLFIICDASIETCQKRILERGDSLDEEFHNEDDLQKYRARFLMLFEASKKYPNIMFVNTDD
jgi:thymidylate kinase